MEEESVSYLKYLFPLFPRETILFPNVINSIRPGPYLQFENVAINFKIELNKFEFPNGQPKGMRE